MMFRCFSIITGGTCNTAVYRSSTLLPKFIGALMSGVPMSIFSAFYLLCHLYLYALKSVFGTLMSLCTYGMSHNISKTGNHEVKIFQSTQSTFSSAIDHARDIYHGMPVDGPLKIKRKSNTINRSIILNKHKCWKPNK